MAEGTTLSPVSCTVPTPLTPKIWPSAPNIFSKIFLHHYIFRTRVSIWLYSSMTCGHIIGVRTIFHLPRTSHYCTLVAVLIWDITGSPHNVILCSLIPIPYYSIHPLLACLRVSLIYGACAGVFYGATEWRMLATSPRLWFNPSPAPSPWRCSSRSRQESAKLRTVLRHQTQFLIHLYDVGAA